MFFSNTQKQIYNIHLGIYTTLGGNTVTAPVLSNFPTRNTGTQAVRAALKVGHIDNLWEYKPSCRFAQVSSWWWRELKWPPAAVLGRVCQQPGWDMSWVGSILHEPYAANSSGPAGPHWQEEPKSILAAVGLLLRSSQGCGPDSWTTVFILFPF